MGTDVILPQFITLRDTGNYYMGLYSSSGARITFDSLRSIYGVPDHNTTFEVVPYGSERQITLKGANGKFVNQYWDSSIGSYFRCAGDEGVSFDIIHVKGNQISLRSYTTKPVFITSRQASNKDGVAGSSFADTDTLFTVSEPIITKDILDVHYDLANAVMLEVPPTIALTETIHSETHPVQQTFSYSYQHSKVGTWNNTAGIELGVETTFKADVPFMASGGVKASLKASYSHQWGGSEGTQETVASSTQITISPRRNVKVTVLVKNKKMDIKFHCKQKIVYKNGTTKISDKDGVYHNVESYDVDIQVEDV